MKIRMYRRWNSEFVVKRMYLFYVIFLNLELLIYRPSRVLFHKIAIFDETHHLSNIFLWVLQLFVYCNNSKLLPISNCILQHFTNCCIFSNSKNKLFTAILHKTLFISKFKTNSLLQHFKIVVYFWIQTYFSLIYFLIISCHTLY